MIFLLSLCNNDERFAADKTRIYFSKESGEVTLILFAIQEILIRN
jgi:hypothetical protein